MLDRGMLELIFIHALRCPQTASVLLQAGLEPVHLSGFAYQSFGGLWDIAGSVMRDAKQLPTPMMMEAMLPSRLQQGSQPYEDARRLAQVAYAVDFGALKPSILQDSGILQQFLDQVILDPALVAVGTGQTLKDRIEALQRAQLVSTNARVVSAQSEDIFNPNKWGAYVYADPPIPTGVSWLDGICGGGLFPGSTLGLLAASGGGKTTFAAQLGVSTIIQKKRVMWLTYEQPVFGDIPMRFYANATGLPMRAFVGDPSKFSPEARDGLQAFWESGFPQYLKVYDMAGTYGQGRGGIQEISAMIARAAESGEKPDVVVIDWIGPLSKMATNIPDSLDTDASKVEYVMNEIKVMAAQHRVTVIPLHQLTPGNVEGASCRKLFDWTEAHNCKSFGLLTNYVVTFSRHDKKFGTHCMQAYASKARNSGGDTRIVRLNGAYACIVDMDGKAIMTPEGTPGPVFVGVDGRPLSAA